MHKKKTGRGNKIALAAAAVVLFFALFGAVAVYVEGRMKPVIADAGSRLTSYEEPAPEIYVDGRRYAERQNLRTTLVMGVDKPEMDTGEDSYNNSGQADFLFLLVYDDVSDSYSAIHLNRDAMTSIPMLGVRGERAGHTFGQLALAHTYGSGLEDSCENTVEAVSDLLYGIQVDRYVALSMDAVPVLNDYVGGVEVKVLDDFSAVDPSLVQGETVLLQGEHALSYVRTRQGLDDSSNLHRMERQRQYIQAWIERAQDTFSSEKDSAELMLQLNDYMVSDCSVDELAELTGVLNRYSQGNIYELPGEAVKGEEFMEYHLDEAGIRNLVLSLFYTPAEE